MPPKKSESSPKTKHEKDDASKRLLKSLITLDSYEQDIFDDTQGEVPIDDEEPESKSASRKQSLQLPPAEKTQVETEFEEAEAERDAKLPAELRKLRPRGYDLKLPPVDRAVRVYADGVFDLFHLGHMKQLEQAKKSLPNVTMVVGVPNDELTHKYKGLTVLDENQRYESLKHCRWVDEVIPNAPWEVNQEFLDEHNIDYVAHDDEPYAGPDGQDDVYKFVKERGQFIATQRTNGISTSDIITRIVKDYDLYLMRNFKRGVSRKELNVSWMKKNELDIKRHVNAFRESWRHNVETTTRDLYADLLSYALNAPPNSVLGRARNWVSRHIESRSGSPHESDGESENGSSPLKRADTSRNEENDEADESRDEEPRSPKRRRVSAK